MSKLFRKVSLLIVILGTFVVGIFVGYRNVPEIDKVRGIDHKTDVIASQVDFAPFWKAWNILNDKYVPADISSTTPEKSTMYTQKMVWGAIAGLAGSLGDPYTAFFPPAENEIFKGDIKGNFEGVGMEIAIKDDVLTVVSPLKGSPSEKAGIKPLDKVLEIDGESTHGVTIEDAVSKIRGPKGTAVKLTILRGKETEPIKLSVVRDVIDVPSLKSEVVKNAKGDVYVIHLYNFSATSPQLFRDALQKFTESGTNKLIIDLRGNPGGYLEAAVDMASWFLPEGKTVVREYFGKGKGENVHRSRGYNVFNDNLKLVVMIDQGSASASEILAAALSENRGTPLVGEKSFGKGSVQELVDITDTTSLKVTVARWLTPNGLSISEKGVTPDYVVSITKEDIEKGKDPQLNKAIEIINQ
jgi:carboxyl-terminal processing protease